jgi:hypothetical protein
MIRTNTNQMVNSAQPTGEANGLLELANACAAMNPNGDKTTHHRKNSFLLPLTCSQKSTSFMFETGTGGTSFPPVNNSFGLVSGTLGIPVLPLVTVAPCDYSPTSTHIINQIV